MVEIKDYNIADYRVSVAVYGLMLLIIVYIGRIQELVPNLNNLSVGKITFVMSVFLFIVSPRDRENSLTGSVQIKYVVGICILVVLSIPFSYWPGGSLNYATQVYVKTVIFFLLIITAVSKLSEINKIVWAVTCSVFFLSITALFSGQEGRLSASSTYDPNDLAFVMVTFMPVVYYFMKQKTGFAKIFLLTVIVMMLIAMLATASRGGVVGLIVIAAVIFKKQGKSLKQAIFPLIVIIIVVKLFASTIFWERMSTMSDLNEDYNVTAGGGRMEIWKNGLKMMARRPLTGVGANAFEVAEGEFHGGMGKWNAPHNSFVQIGAELGVIGLILFVKLLTSSIKSIRECRENNADGKVPNWLLDGTEVAFYGYMTTGFFLSQAYSSVLYLLVALAILAQKLHRQPSSGVAAIAP